MMWNLFHGKMGSVTQLFVARVQGEMGKLLKYLILTNVYNYT
jgi:hypothetical protein